MSTILLSRKHMRKHSRSYAFSFIDYKTRSGIKFAYAAMRQKGKGSSTLRSLYLNGKDHSRTLE